MKRIIVFLLFAGIISVNNSFAESNSQKINNLVTVFIQEVLPSDEYKNLVLGSQKAIKTNLIKLESSLSSNVKNKLAQVEKLNLSDNQIKSLIKQNDNLLSNVSKAWIPNAQACGVSHGIVLSGGAGGLIGWIGVWIHCGAEEE